MSIPVEQEDVASLKAWGLGLEKMRESCVLCRTPTSTWHKATNQPVCESCASSHHVSDLPAKRSKQAEPA